MDQDRNKNQGLRRRPNPDPRDGQICRILGGKFENLLLAEKLEVLKLELKFEELIQNQEDGDYRDEQTYFRTNALWAIADALESLAENNTLAENLADLPPHFEEIARSINDFSSSAEMQALYIKDIARAMSEE